MAVSLETGGLDPLVCHLKAKFAELVKACGGLEACAAVLGISHVAVSQMQTLSNPDRLPNLGHVVRLEQFLGRSLMLRDLAQWIDDRAPVPASLLTEALEATSAVVELQTAIAKGGGARVLGEALTRAKAELADVARIISRGGEP